MGEEARAIEPTAEQRLDERERRVSQQEAEVRERTGVATARERALARHAAELAARERAAADEERRLAELAAGLATLREELDEREVELARRTAPPRVELNPPEEPLSGTAALVVAAENVAAPVTLEVAAAGSDDWRPAPGSGPRLDTRALDDGRWRVRAVAGDAASDEVAIVVDNDPPVARVLAPEPGTVVSGPVQVRARADDAASGVDWVRVERSIDGERWRPVSGDTWDTTEDADGDWLLRAVAVDRVGNAGMSDPVRVTVRNVVGAEPLAAAPRGRPTLMDLEHLVEARIDLDSDRAAELHAILYHLRDFAGVDGRIPTEFDALVDAEFGALM